MAEPALEEDTADGLTSGQDPLGTEDPADLDVEHAASEAQRAGKKRPLDGGYGAKFDPNMKLGRFYPDCLTLSNSNLAQS